jgi:hypothetical protein
MTLDEDEIAAWTVRTRAACGLPAVIEDAATLARIVTLAFGPSDAAEEEGGGRAEGA